MTPSSSSLFILFLLLLSTMDATSSSRKQRQAHLHFYFHNAVSGPNATVATVATGPSGQRILFGAISVIDDAITEFPEATSRVIGRAQGMYVSDTLNATALLVTMTMVFTAGEFNGSTLSVMGQNHIFMPVRELPVVGGTGAFRFAKGYALVKTYSFNTTTGDAVTEYDVYVWLGLY